mmetsp:Transcript_13100/g.21215  ORF Transcript_13100/g.21215 Transcript_13100/m.21215 type:complete len:483 (-) Transcript_13100:528-1976(-)
MLHLHSLFKVPQECLNRNFRPCQKSVEKDITGPIGLVSELCKRLNDQEENDVNWGKVVVNLERVEDRLKGIKRNLENAAGTGDKLVEQTFKRVRFAENCKKQEYNDLLIADHMVRRGYSKSAQSFAREKGLCDLVDSIVFQKVYEIALDLKENRNIEPALEWCSQNKSRLRRINSSLEFELRRFGFLQLVQKSDTIRAVQYAKKYLSPYASVHLQEIQRTMASLAFAGDGAAEIKIKQSDGLEKDKSECVTDESQLKRRKVESSPSAGNSENDDVSLSSDTNTLLSEAAWDKLCNLFEEDSNRVLSLEQQTTLEVMVKAGLSVLRTPSCSHIFSEYQTGKRGPKYVSIQMWQQYIGLKPKEDMPGKSKDDQNADSDLEMGDDHESIRVLWEPRTLDCPCCSESLGKVAAMLPISNRMHSSIVCRLSANVMNHDNPPMVLPNGQVFSLEALEKMSEEDQSSKITCPITGDRFQMDQLKRVFIT